MKRKPGILLLVLAAALALSGRPGARMDFDAVPITGGTVRLENGVAQGGGENRFEPLRTCTRAEIVTFLRRTFGE